MRYDSATHTARAALLAEGAALSTSPRQRVNLLAHAVIAKGLARMASEGVKSCACIFMGDTACCSDELARLAWRH